MRNLNQAKMFWHFFKEEFRKGTHLIYLYEARYTFLIWGLISIFATTKDFILGEISTSLFLGLSLTAYAIIVIPFQYEINEQMAMDEDDRF